MAKKWSFPQHDAGRVAELEQKAKISPVLAQLLIARGYSDPLVVDGFLEARLSDLRAPEELPGIEGATARLHAAIGEGRKIAIYGDYDCDGMSATAILYLCLRMLRADVVYHIPNRLEDGYGLNDAALRMLAARGVQTVVTVDCGIASVAEADLARELGLELIITDHHEFADRLPRADAIVHPRLPGHAYPFGGLCGAGVAFKLAWSICQSACDAKKVSAPMRDFLLQAVGLAALGAVADVVPLLDENRILVRNGLKSLSSQPTLGIAALMEITRRGSKSPLASEDIAFMIAPRLNAAGRLGQAQLGVELLTTANPDRAEALAEYINQLNAQRDSVERSIYLEALKQAKEQFDPDNDPALVLAGDGWHPGVIGIVAGRLAEKFNLPVILIALDATGNRPGIGSARTACKVSLHESLNACSEHLVAHGGHAAAAGLKIERDQVEAFREAFCEGVRDRVQASGRIAELRIDAETQLSQLTLNAVRQIEKLAPFGEGNPRPVLCATSVVLSEPPKHLGSGERHLAVQLKQHSVSIRGVAFGKGEWLEPLANHQGPIDIAYRPVINEFRGRQSVELHLVDWRGTTRERHVTTLDA